MPWTRPSQGASYAFGWRQRTDTLTLLLKTMDRGYRRNPRNRFLKPSIRQSQVELDWGWPSLRLYWKGWEPQSTLPIILAEHDSRSNCRLRPVHEGPDLGR